MKSNILLGNHFSNFTKMMVPQTEVTEPFQGMFYTIINFKSKYSVLCETVNKYFGEITDTV